MSVDGGPSPDCGADLSSSTSRGTGDSSFGMVTFPTLSIYARGRSNSKWISVLRFQPDPDPSLLKRQSSLSAFGRRSATPWAPEI